MIHNIGKYVRTNLSFNKHSWVIYPIVYLDELTHNKIYENLPIYGYIGLGLPDRLETYNDVAFDILKNQFNANRAIIELRFDDINGHL